MSPREMFIHIRVSVSNVVRAARNLAGKILVSARRTNKPELRATDAPTTARMADKRKAKRQAFYYIESYSLDRTRSSRARE